ncbi:nucleotide sugar dehydrogenase [Persicimonas caeni]|uniref:Nucleotide sugar dehydrogenase n=1 Tax=Persicimonas caeni TaxID=2292766 RepID=A0A4Y6PUL0_PERCE|nr:nucleotide sugar dehydrogenase [Persicimonas caeni]QDG51697.1 nucleotide sugar dehydrogenase [Persicimonas caeni]QED32918.1 nucleotide sugar dehydrogenase [Persicimonas caeni]
MSDAVSILRKKFTNQDATVAVIGQGYVGLPLALEFVEAGFRCYGVDVAEAKVEQLAAGQSYITDIASERVARAIESGRYIPTTDFAVVGEADAISICVPTPLNKTREPDLSFIRSAAASITPHLRRPSLVVLESTTYPGTTEEVLVPVFERAGHKIDEDLFVAFSPERVDPGNETYGLTNTPKVVGGVTPDSTALVEALYGQFINQVHPVSNATEAEMVKLLENTFRAVNIALVNEMAVMCDRMGIDIWQVIEAASTKPFGFMPFYPGPGIGGHCIPLDPTYLSWKAKTFGYYNRFIELASDLNTNMPRFVVQKLVRLLNEQQRSVNGARILLVGVAYKPDVNDLRESPALDIWKSLEEWGANLSYHDPHIECVDTFDGARSVDLDAAMLAEQDAVVVVTNHSAVDYKLLVEHAPLVFDTRNALDHDSPNIYKL